ncbi:DUF1648 domain-containing protein [Nocardioides sp. MAHUQ-72]|uniref:DUF1648 domain-containing protein n=1 Tax=unclassified Nocardioides TaxID=2615069 RepID=UPI0036194D2A
MSRAARKVVTGGLVGLAPIAVVVARSATAGNLPDPVPTHWDLHGRADDSVGLAVLFTTCLLVATGLWLATTVLAFRSREDRTDRTLVAAGAWAAWLAAMVFVVPVATAYGEARAADVRVEPVWLAALVLAPTLVAALVWRLQPVTLRPRRAGAAPATPLTLRDGERATWVGRSSSSVLMGVAAVLVVVSVFLVFTAWPVANVVALVALAVFWTHVVTVRVDDSGVTTSWGPARWPRVRVPLEQLEGARAEEIEPRRWGGWGYRFSSRGRAVVTRRGPGVVLELRDGSAFAVTVDGAAEAADLVNALVERDARCSR